MDVRIQLDEADVAALRIRTGIENAREAAVDWIRRAKAPESHENAGERARAAFEALRKSAQNAPLKNLRPAEVDAIIRRVRQQHAAQSSG